MIGTPIVRENPDSEFLRRKYEQNLESMRHVQKLEATEMGFVITAYGILIAGLLNVAAKSPALFGPGLAFVLSILVIAMAGLFCWHFLKRRKSFYGHRKSLNESLKALGEPFDEKEEWSGHLTRVGMIAILIATAIIVIFIVA
jgi:hypothetical protein